MLSIWKLIAASFKLSENGETLWMHRKNQNPEIRIKIRPSTIKINFLKSERNDYEKQGVIA